MTDQNKLENFQAKKVSPDRPFRFDRSIDHGRGLQPLNEPENSEFYSGVGLLLRVERQRLEMSLSEVSEKLRIQRDHLVALEEGRTAELPGATYAAGFLRTYSKFLGLDGEEIVRLYKSEGTLTSGEQRLIFLEPLEEARRPGLTLAIISLVIAGVIYAGWIFLERSEQVFVETVSEPPRRFLSYNAETIVPKHASTTKVQPLLSENLRDEDIKEKIGLALDGLQRQSEPRGPDIGENKLIEISGGNGSIKIKTKSIPGEGERAAAADVMGLVRFNADRPININAKPFAENDKAKLKNVLEKPSELPDLKKRKVAATNNIGVSPHSPNKETNEVNSRQVVPTDQTAVVPLASNSREQLLPSLSANASNDISDEGASIGGASEIIGYRPKVFGTSARNTRVVLLARKGTWMQVKGDNDELLLTRMLRPGDSYHAPDRTDLVLTTGNAGAIDLMIDGKIWGALGRFGQVRRNIKLNADNLRANFHSPATEN